MIFNINTMLNEQNSGIEHAELQREQVLRQAKIPFKQVYLQQNLQLHRWTKLYGLADDEVIDLYDYYQDRLNEPEKHVTVDQIKLTDQPVERVFDQEAQFYLDRNPNNGTIWGRIRLFPGTNRVRILERFDGFGNLYRCDLYDWRGFLSYSQFYNPDNQVTHYTWFNKIGQPVITWVLASRNQKHTQPIDSIILIDRHGHRRVYENEAQLMAGFLDDLNSDYYQEQRPNIFVTDRTARTEFAMGDLNLPAVKVFHLHNDHRSGMTNDPHSLMNNNYEYNFYNLQQFDFVITATEKQRRDVIQRFKLDSDHVVRIPVGLVKPVDRVAMNKRVPHSVLATCRVAEEKRVDWMVEAIALAMKEVPDIYLDVYGYLDHRHHDGAKKKIDAIVKKYPEVEKHFKLHGYQKSLDSERDQHQIYLVASTMEGFNIALMEAQNHGEVGLTVDVDYGPNELVQDKVNGLIVKDPKDFAKQLVKLFKQPEQLQSMSDKAYELSHRYDSQHIAKQWRQLLATAQCDWDALPMHYKKNWQTAGLEEEI